MDEAKRNELLASLSGRLTRAVRLYLEGRATYHDPCQIARNGGIYEQPRAVIRALSGDFVDLEPNRAENWCCGGGGGLVAMGEEVLPPSHSTLPQRPRQGARPLV